MLCLSSRLFLGIASLKAMFNASEVTIVQIGKGESSLDLVKIELLMLRKA